MTSPPARVAVVLVAVLASAPVGGARAATGPLAPSGVDSLPSPVTLKNLQDTPYYEDVLSHSFETILSDSQLAAYSVLSSAERETYRRRFWVWNDPTPATDENEFLDEHVRRLDCALANFCPNGDLDWDDRGDMVLRFGLPDARVCEVGDFMNAYGGMGLSPSSETWVYSREEMTLHFIDPTCNDRYILGSDTKHVTAHGRPRAIPAGEPSLDIPPEPAPTPRNIEAEHMAYRAKTMGEKGQVAVEDVPVGYAYTPASEPLTVFYEVVTAKGAGGKTDVAVNYEVPLVEFSDATDVGAGTTWLEKRLRVTDENFDVLMTDARTLSVSFEGLAGPGPYTLCDEWRLETPPGEYVVGLALSDTSSGRSGHGRSRVAVPDYSAPGLRMSDIQLALKVAEGPRFRRLGGSVVPRPSHAFRRDEELIIYFEVYGLTEDRPGESRFTVTTEVLPRQHEKDEGWFSGFVSRLFPEGKHSVSSRVVGTGDVPDTAYWFGLSLKDLAEDNYDLTVTVKDVRSKAEVRKTVAFTVLED